MIIVQPSPITFSGTYFCVENIGKNRQKKTKTLPNTKFYPIFNGGNTNKSKIALGIF